MTTSSEHAERTILGAILLDSTRLLEIAEVLKPEDFYLDCHRLIFAAMISLAQAQLPVDTCTLPEELTKRAKLQSIGATPIAFISSLTEGLPMRPELDSYIAIVKDKSTRRRLITIANALSARAEAGDATGQELAAWGIQAVSEITAVERNRLLRLKKGSDVVSKPREWIIPGLLPAATLSALVGLPGTGKTTVGLAIAADLTCGKNPIVGGKRAPATVLYLSNEDDESTLITRFRQLGGDADRIFIEDAEDPTMWTMENFTSLEARIDELAPAMVVIDSLGTHKPRKLDLNSHGDMAGLLVPLRLSAERQNSAVVLVHHLNKGQNSDPNARIMGSTAILSTCRAVLMVGPSPDDPERNMLAVSKTNLASKKGAGFFYQIEPEFKWGKQTDVSASAMLAGAISSQSSAERFLRTVLAKGAMNGSEVIQLGEDDGMSRSSIYCAAKKIGVVMSTKGFGKNRAAMWSFPDVQQKGWTNGTGGTDGIYGTNGTDEPPISPINPIYPKNPEVCVDDEAETRPGQPDAAEELGEIRI